MREKLKRRPGASRSPLGAQLVPPEEFAQLMEDARSGWLTPSLASWYLSRRYDPFRHDLGLQRYGATIRDRRAAFTKIVPSIRAHMLEQLDTTRMLKYDYQLFLSVKVGYCYWVFLTCEFTLPLCQLCINYAKFDYELVRLMRQSLVLAFYCLCYCAINCLFLKFLINCNS